MGKEKKIVIATGTRAEWGLLSPLAKELRNRGERPLIAATYAHLFEDMGHTLREIEEDGFEVAARIATRREAAAATADAIEGFSRYFEEERPDMAVILGDRFEMLGVATAALLKGIRIAHIAGGTTSQGAYDEAIRHSISHMATLHFPETEKGRKKLEAMGIAADKIFTAGALGVYNTLNGGRMTRRELTESLGIDLGKDYILATFHPATVDEKTPLRQMSIFTEGIRKFLMREEAISFLLTYPNTDTDVRPLIAELEALQKEFPGRVWLYNSLGRERYLSAARGARGVAGNSSSGIVEVPSLGTPVLDIGDRQKGRERSRAVRHSGLEAEEISEKLSEIITDEARQEAKEAPNPYYQPETPSLIAEKILTAL